MPIIGTRSAWAMRLGRGEADPHAGEQAGPDVDGDGADLAERRCRPGRHTNSIAGASVSAWRRPRPTSNSAEHALVAADRAR